MIKEFLQISPGPGDFRGVPKLWDGVNCSKMVLFLIAISGPPPSPQIYVNINTVHVATALGWLIVGGTTQRLGAGNKWMHIASR